MLFCVAEDQGCKVQLDGKVLVHHLWPAAATSSDLCGAVVLVVVCVRFYWMVVVSPP